jgi:PKD repeat protein
VTAAFEALGAGTYDVGLRVTDLEGLTNAEFTTATVLPADDPYCNQPPVAQAGGPYSGDEGSAIQLNGSGSNDPDEGDVLSYEWTIADPQSLCSITDTTAVSPSVTCTDNGIFTLTLTVSDADFSDSDVTTLTVNNVAPDLGAITGPVDPVEVNTSIDIGADFTDPGTSDTHTAECDWDDGTVEVCTVTETEGSGSVSGSHVYTSAGIYTVTVTVTDDDGGADEESYQYVVVYDPGVGFITGGGWIDSPAGAYVADPTLSGSANFGFVSKYLKKSNEPVGQTQFQFQAGSLNFHSGSYEWLVVTGTKAMFKGTGTINGTGNYGFMISVVDAALTPSTPVDLFRIKIWDKDANDALVYDNEIGAAEDAAPTTQIAGGSIVIHNK